MDFYETSFLTDSLRRRFSSVTFSTLGDEKIISAKRYLGAVPLEFSITFSTKDVKLSLSSAEEQFVYDLYSKGKYLTLTKVSWADVLINICTAVEESYSYKPLFFGPGLFSSQPDLKLWLSKEIARVCSFGNSELPLLVTDLDEPQPEFITVNVSTYPRTSYIKVIFPEDTPKYFECELTSENVLKFLGWYTKSSPVDKASLNQWFNF
jgi:hypothetical protein